MTLPPVTLPPVTLPIPEAFRPPLAAARAAAGDGEIGVAVSGGSDSLALLLLLREAGARVAALTVDHGLRPESAAEARTVAGLCAARGIPHEVRTWERPGATGNLQDRAREARRELIAAWAKRRSIAAVALGHTLDDQAETFLLRLARGSGVDGLSAMRPVSEALGLRWLRPLLDIRRGALRDWLAETGVTWAEDPSNADLRFDRVRARLALPALAGLGLGAERLATTARAMARARAALERATADLARLCLADGGAGDLLLDPLPFADAAEELRLRLLAGALGWVSGARYRPRLVRLEAALAAIDAGRVGHGLTLHGCVLRARAGRVAIRRELARMADAVPLAAGRWDARWQLEGTPPDGPGLTIGALGAGGLARLSSHRAGPAREALAATPAVWRGGELMAAPLAEAAPRPGLRITFRRVSAVPPPWGSDRALNPPDQPLC
ncbi:MAG TPA: tRNA lysidine(34) synthetase TilS [Amaricoccus sp.]|nr:tRNA lysidine(34) synthetase TilS [Amaricoccus sp.]